MLNRRDFLARVAAAAAAGALPLGCRAFAGSPPPASRMRTGYAAITWGGADLQAIDDIAALGYPGIQLRSGAIAQFGADPAGLRARLAARNLTFVALSSGNVGIDPARQAQTIAEHASHARFLRAGRVDLPAVFDALRDIRFDGWSIVELDSVAGTGRTARRPRTTRSISSRAASGSDRTSPPASAPEKRVARHPQMCGARRIVENVAKMGESCHEMTVSRGA